MKKRVFAIILAALTAVIAIGCSDDNGENTGSEISDGIEIPEYITIQDEQFSTELTELNLSDRQLNNNDIEPLKYMVNLTELILGENEISDISALSGLTNLTTLVLQTNKISDISPLAGLVNLTVLMLPGNEISDISALSGLTNLDSLSLADNSITDLRPLAELKNLSMLYLLLNPFIDVSPLAGLTDLKYLSLLYSQVSDEKIAELREALPYTQVHDDPNIEVYVDH